MFTSTLATLTATLAATGLASPTRRQGPVQYGVEVTYSNGTTLPAAACHAGAAIEALCVYPDTSSKFTFKHVASDPLSPGFLQFQAPSNGNELQQLSPIEKAGGGNNVEPAYFGGSTNDAFSLLLSADNELGVDVNGQSQENFYVCPYANLGYTYQTVSFVVDNATPTDLNCQKVSVKLV